MLLVLLVLLSISQHSGPVVIRAIAQAHLLEYNFLLLSYYQKVQRGDYWRNNVVYSFCNSISGYENKWRSRLDARWLVHCGAPYKKPNDDPLYINKHSNHPPSILRQLPTSINKRISTLSSDKQTFEDAAPPYQNALGHSNFSHKLEYTPHETQRPRRNRQRNVIWFNLPFSKNVKGELQSENKLVLNLRSYVY